MVLHETSAAAKQEEWRLASDRQCPVCPDPSTSGRLLAEKEEEASLAMPLSSPTYLTLISSLLSLFLLSIKD